MKTATIREAQHHLSKILRDVEAGEEVIVTRRGKEVGLIGPPPKKSSGADTVDWSEALRHRDRMLGDLPKMERNIVLEMREEERY